MDAIDEIEGDVASGEDAPVATRVQAGTYLLELSLDWIVRRASENVHRLLGESHVTLIDEPLGKFVHAQSLHDLRNLFSKLSGTTGIGRAFAVRLTDSPALIDIAFQLVDGRALLEAVASPGSFGESFGSVGGLIAGLSSSKDNALIEGGARRMRALTGYDRVTLNFGHQRAESSRGGFSGSLEIDGLPNIVSEREAEGVDVFPRVAGKTAADVALLRLPTPSEVEKLRHNGVRAALRIPFEACGIAGEFRCESRSPRKPSFEVHAAAELFAQMFALRLESEAAAKR